MILDRQPSSDRRKEIEDRAKMLKKGVRENDLNPVVIEFAGSPKSGKTTNIEIITHFFKRMDLKVWAPTEGASKRTPYHLKHDWVAFNCWSLTYAIQELLVAYNNVDKHDLIILDRGPFDSLAWMGLLKSRKNLSDEEFDTIKNFALLKKWGATIERIYLFTCDPSKSLERETQAKLTTRHGSAMNPKILKDLLGEYENLKSTLAEYPVKMLDTSETESPLQSAWPIASDICSLFEAKIQGVG